MICNPYRMDGLTYLHETENTIIGICLHAKYQQISGKRYGIEIITRSEALTKLLGSSGGRGQPLLPRCSFALDCWPVGKLANIYCGWCHAFSLTGAVHLGMMEGQKRWGGNLSGARARVDSLRWLLAVSYRLKPRGHSSCACWGLRISVWSLAGVVCGVCWDMGWRGRSAFGAVPLMVEACWVWWVSSVVGFNSLFVTNL
jgi:hypothetical protein